MSTASVVPSVSSFSEFGLDPAIQKSLAAEGYAEVELDQIGDMDGEPDEEPHLSAFQGALEGEVSIVTFEVPL